MKINILKSFVLTLIVSTVVALPVASAAAGQSTNLVIGISPHLAASSKAVVLANIGKLLLGLPPGTPFGLYNGGDGSEFNSGVSPTLAFDSPAARMTALATTIVALRDWVNKQTPSSESVADGLNPPVFLRSVGGLSDSGSAVILLVGSTMYQGDEPSFRFAPNRLPSLGQIGLSEAVSPFGCAERRTLLHGITVHWWYISPSSMPYEAYANASLAWWRSWIQAQSGGLGQFTHDWAAITQNLLRAAAPQPSFDLSRWKSEDGKPRMVPVPRRAGFEETPDSVAPSPVAPVRPITLASPPAPAVQTNIDVEDKPEVVVAPPVALPEVEKPKPAPAPAPPVVTSTGPQPVPPHVILPHIEIPKVVDRTVSSVGILWHATGHDLDLSARVKPGSSMANPGELYWNAAPARTAGPKTNALGKYLNDIRDGGKGNEYEWIELARQTSVSDLETNLEIWCNHYVGRGPVTFTAVIVDKGSIVARREFTLFGNGDRRMGSAKRERSASWIRLPIEEMLREGAVIQTAAK